MKKIVFAIQVFGLIAMFPIVVCLEINHVPEGSSRPEATSIIITKAKHPSICLYKKASYKMSNEVFSIMLETFLLKKPF